MENKNPKWISVENDLPDYEKPVFLKSSDGEINVGFRDSTDTSGQLYLLLKKPILQDKKCKVVSWAELKIPIN